MESERNGIGFLSSHTVQLEVQAKRLVILDVAGFPIVRNWYIVHRTDKRLSPVVRAFKQFLLREAATRRWRFRAAPGRALSTRRPAG